MLDSGILESTINYKKVQKNLATHFTICNKDKVRYFVSLNNGKSRLVKNISPYSRKLSILMKIIILIPFKILEIFKIGYFVNLELCNEVEEFIKKTSYGNSNWNIIIGTYDRKQKIVIQLWESKYSYSKYYKIGNKYSNKEMLSEIKFLKENNTYKTFDIPKILNSQMIQDSYKFNIQLTEEFLGDKVQPNITDDIYIIFKELINSKEIEYINGIPYGFSHGDFTPWNMRKRDSKYILFDWEHCGIRFYGFDIIHYSFNVEYRLKKKTKEEAIINAVEEVKKKESLLRNINSKQLIDLYFNEFYGEL